MNIHNNVMIGYTKETIQFYKDLLDTIIQIANQDKYKIEKIIVEDPYIRSFDLIPGLTLKDIYSKLISKIRPHPPKVKVKIIDTGIKGLNPAKVEITITPITLRIVYPHRSIEIENVHKILVNNFFIIKQKRVQKIEESALEKKWNGKFYRMKGLSYQEKYLKLADYLLEIQNKDEFNYMCRKMRIKPYDKDNQMILYGEIMSQIKIYNDISVEIAISKMKRLISFRTYLKRIIESVIHRSLKNLVFGNKGRLKIEINSHYELRKLIAIYRRIGIVVIEGKIVDAIEKDRNLADFLLQDQEDRSWNNEKIDRVASLISGWVKRPDIAIQKMKDKNEISPTFIPFHFKLHQKRRRRSKDEINRLIAEQDKIDNFDGKYHKRNSKLPVLIKERENYRCESCYQEQGKDIFIEVSHRIPLNFGFELGGVDKSCNMEVLCHDCHMKYEENFDRSIFDNPRIKTKSDLINFLKKRFSDNFKYSNYKNRNWRNSQFSSSSPRIKRKQKSKKSSKLRQSNRSDDYLEYRRVLRDQKKQVEFCMKRESFGKKEAKKMAKKHKLIAMHCNNCYLYHVVKRTISQGF